jgi:pyrroline-5-carboxylate reductase
MLRTAIGIIGLGRLGSALARGLDRADEVGSILGYNRTQAKAENLAARVSKLHLCGSAADVIEGADLVFLWTNPEDAVHVLRDNAALLARTNPLIVTCIAGVPLTQHVRRWAETLPNVNMAVGRGVTAVHYGPTLGPSDREGLHKVLAVVGTVYELPVEEIPFYSALCSCGPALYATAMELMADTLSAHRGYDTTLCRRMVHETVSGTIALVEADGVNAAEVVHRVAHPGGPSEAGTLHLREHLPALLEGMLVRMRKW